MRSNCKNYTEPGGNKTVIGGRLEIKQGATVTGLAADPLQPATTEALGGIKVGDGLAGEADGTLSVAPASAEALGGVIAGDGLSVDSDGVISLDLTPAEAVADCEAEDVAGVVTSLNALLASLRAAGLLEASADD